MKCKITKFQYLFNVILLITILLNFCAGQYINENDYEDPQLPREIPFCRDTGTIYNSNESLIPQWCSTKPSSRLIFPCKNSCRNDDGTFATRRCGLIDGVGRWSEIYNPCNNSNNLSVLTTFLNSEVSPSTLNNVSAHIKTGRLTLTEFEVDLTANILSKASNLPTKAEYTESFFDVANNLLSVNQSVLKTSRKYGSTDKIIKSIDNFVIGLSQETTTSYSLNLRNIALEIINPIQTNQDDHFNISFNNIEVKIPKKNLNTAVLTTYKSNHLFPEGKTISDIVDLKVLGVTEILNDTISLYLYVDPTKEVVCSFWKFNEEEIGNWSIDGVETIRLSDDLVECKTNHLTAFVLLGVSDRIIENLSSANQLALNIISTILCSLSLIGLNIIFVTCFVLKKWYLRRIYTIQISIVIALEIFLIFLNDTITIQNGLDCKLFGIFMHYLVLVKFAIMLLIARMQYENFVTVLTSRGRSRKFLYATFVALCIPIIIVGISAGIFPERYNSGNVNFCYPKDEAFIFFLIIPIASILIANTIIFGLVMFEISHSISRDNKQKILQFKLAIMMFFMLGLTWIFSVVSHVVYTDWLQLVFIYTFSILSPLQGFVIFIFAIVFDSDARMFWLDCCKNLKYKYLETENSKNTTSSAVLMSSVALSDDNN